MLSQWGSTQRKQTGREFRQDRWCKLAKRIFLTTEHHGQYMNWKESSRRVADLGSGGANLPSVTGQWGIAFCITFFSKHYYYCCYYRCCCCYYHCCCCILLNFQLLKLFLSQHTSFTIILLPNPAEWRGRDEGLSKGLCGVSSPTGLKPQDYSESCCFHSLLIT